MSAEETAENVATGASAASAATSAARKVGLWGGARRTLRGLRGASGALNGIAGTAGSVMILMQLLDMLKGSRPTENEAAIGSQRSDAEQFFQDPMIGQEMQQNAMSYGLRGDRIRTDAASMPDADQAFLDEMHALHKVRMADQMQRTSPTYAEMATRAGLM